jgi:LacI family transcriptional regulator
MRDAGISLPRSMIAEGNYRFESGLIAAERLLDVVPRPTAIFSCNDEMAAGVIHAACQRGLVVPRDLSVIGFDDTPISAHMWPPLTTVRWPIASMARSAALKLITGVADNDDDGGVQEPSMFLSTLIRRSSVASPAD